MKKLSITALILALVGALLTGGYFYNERQKEMDIIKAGLPAAAAFYMTTSNCLEEDANVAEFARNFRSGFPNIAYVSEKWFANLVRKYEGNAEIEAYYKNVFAEFASRPCSDAMSVLTELDAAAKYQTFD